MPMRERRRVGKLARSGQPITEPNDAKRPEAMARLGVSGLREVRRLRPLILLGVLIAVPRALVGQWEEWLFRDLPATVVLVVAYLYCGYVRKQYEATARVNGWEI